MSIVGNIHATWTDPLGQEWPLTHTAPERGYFTTFGIAGWTATTYEITTDPMARGGESVRHIRAQPARITWPIHIWGDTHQEFVQRNRDLRRAIMMTVHRQTAGTLTVYRPDGSARSIECFYESGWEGQPGEDWINANPVITLFCPDGGWTDIESITERRTVGAPVSFFSPFLTISASQVIGETVVGNPGDLYAWPVWTITGPATALTATNHTTDQSFTLTHALTTGQTITITTDRPTVRGPAGENLSGALDWPSSYLWGLTPGDNDIEFVVAGGSTDTAIELAFNARYEGA